MYGGQNPTPYHTYRPDTTPEVNPETETRGQILMSKKDYPEHPNNSIHSQTRKAIKVTKIKSEKEIRKLEKIGSRAMNSYIATIRDLSASSPSISTPVQKILREEAFTKLLQTFLGFGNSEAYESFELGLRMNDKLGGSNHV